MGGYLVGDYVSVLIVDCFGVFRCDGSVFDFIEVIEDVLVQVNIDLIGIVCICGVDIIGFIVVLLVYYKDFMLCGWVGDSCVYCVENGCLEQVSVDYVYGMKDDVIQFGGLLVQLQVGVGVFICVIGVEEQFFVDWQIVGCCFGMQFVLCLDGINKEMFDVEMEVQCCLQDLLQIVLNNLFGVVLGWVV